MTNVARQSTYLMIVALGQMIVLIVGGFDLSVGTIIALTSVVSATVMARLGGNDPEAVPLAITLGILAGIGVGMAVGAVNGAGVSLFNIPPFMMTLGMASIGFGIALYMTGGVPVYGMPDAFSDLFGYGQWLGIPTPITITVVAVIVMYILFNWTRRSDAIFMRSAATLRRLRFRASTRGLCSFWRSPFAVYRLP